MSSTIIALIVSIVFIIILVAGFFVGFWRGLKKSTANLIFSIVGIIVAFFVTAPITNLIMNINIDYNGQTVLLSDLALVMARENQDLAILINNNPNIEAIFAFLPQAIVNTVVFILITCAIELVIYIIYRIIAFFLKTKEGEKKHRLSGGFVGLAKVFVITILAFMPLASLVGLANSFTYSESYISESSSQTLTMQTTSSEGETGDGNVVADEPTGDNDAQTNQYGLAGEYLPDQAIFVIRGLEDNLLTKICGVFGLDNAMFDYLSSFDMNGEKFYIRQELETVYPIADFAYQISNTNEIKFYNLNFDKIDGVVEKVVDSSIFKNILTDLIADIIINNQDYSFLKDNQIFVEYSDIIDSIKVNLEAIKSQENGLVTYFTNDIQNIYSAFKELAKGGVVDEIINLEDASFANILNVLTSEANKSEFQSATANLIDVNLVQDSIVPLAQRLVNQISSDFDTINVDTSTWTEGDWDEFATSLTTVVETYANISNEVNITDVLSDPMILLEIDSQTQTPKYNISVIMSNIGSLIDEIRDIKLFKNGETPIIDKLLGENNIVLPTSEVYDQDGMAKTISSYKELLEFVSPSLERIRDTGLYDILTSEQSNDIVSALASLVSEEGNENLLNEIILPIEQVEPTKSIINDLLNSVSNDVIDFSVLATEGTTYEDWSSELSYISELLIELNSEKVESEDKTYLQLALEGNFEVVIDNISEENIDLILKPILYAKTTSSLRNELINSIKTVLDSLVSPSSVTINLNGVVLDEENEEDQAQEVCNVFKAFINLNKVYNAEDIKDVDKTLLSELLTSMQQNAYRSTLSDKTDDGLFKNSFENLMNTIKLEYSDAVAYIETLPEYENYLDETNYPYIDFADLFSKIQEYEDIVNQN